MKKGLWMLLAGLMALGTSVSAFASARLDSMATDARQVGDIDLIWLYPNMVTEYKNTVDFRLYPYGDQGDSENEWGGALVEVDPDFGVLGAYVNRPVDEDSVNFDLTDHGRVRPFFRYNQGQVGNEPGFDKFGAGFASVYSNQVDLFWGKNLASGGNFGVHFNYGNGASAGTNVFALSVGAGLGNVGPFGDLNVHADYEMENFEVANDPNEKSNGVYTAKVGALSTSSLSANNDLRLYADLQFDGFGVNNIPNVTYSDYGAVVGAAINQKIDGGKGLFSTGLSVNYIDGTSPHADADFEEAEWDVLWNTSLEAPVADWLTVRAGLTKDIIARLYDRGSGFYGDGSWLNNAGNNVRFSTGFGINWQNFTLNTSVEAESLENSITDVQPGRGIFYTGDIVTVETADLSYKF